MHDSKLPAPNSSTTIPTLTNTIWLAYSGGVDSHVLLHMFATIPPPKDNFKAIHIHHNLNPNADAWEAHCRKTCEKLGIEFHCIHVDARPKPGESPEAAARHARYEAFATIMEPNNALFTAHHAEDQAETVLLQLFRGTGVKGLAGIPTAIPFAQGVLGRPLLEMSKKEILEYAKEHQLEWIEDDSNNNTDFDRNYIRHHVLPIIRERWPAITPILGRTAQHCAEANEILDKIAERDFTVSIQQLKKLSQAEANNIIRYWLRNQHFQPPSAAQLARLWSDVLYSKPDANPMLRWPGVIIRRYRDTLYALHDQPAWQPPTEAIHWDMQQTLILPNGRTLTAKKEKGNGFRLTENTSVQIRFRQQGERCHPKGRQGSHPLKKLFQEWGVPPWERDAIPLIYINDKLAAIVGYCVCTEFAVDANEEGWIFL